MKGCRTGKKRMKDRVAAEIALMDVRRKAKPGKDQSRAYLCPACRGWHLTSQPLRATNDDRENA